MYDMARFKLDITETMLTRSIVQHWKSVPGGEKGVGGVGGLALDCLDVSKSGSKSQFA